MVGELEFPEVLFIKKFLSDNSNNPVIKPLLPGTSNQNFLKNSFHEYLSAFSVNICQN